MLIMWSKPADGKPEPGLLSEDGIVGDPVQDRKPA